MMDQCKNCAGHHWNCAVMGMADDYCGCKCHKGNAPKKIPRLKRRGS